MSLQSKGNEMKILAVGGGSGGHVTPVAAVLNAIIKKCSLTFELRVWTDRSFAMQTRRTMKAGHVPMSESTLFCLVNFVAIILFHYLSNCETPHDRFTKLFAMGCYIVTGFVQSLT